MLLRSKGSSLRSLLAAAGMVGLETCIRNQGALDSQLTLRHGVTWRQEWDPVHADAQMQKTWLHI